MKSDSIGLAYQAFKRASDLVPNGDASIFHNIGKLYHEKQDEEKSEEFFRKALRCKPNFAPSLEGLSMIHLNKGEFGQCIEYANRAVASAPDETMEARVNRGMAYLALGKWKEGWSDYNANIGKEKNRKEIIYGDEVRWKGEKGLDVVVYGEQGLGDEISFASCLPDLIRDSKSVTLECDVRLEKLFKRSFPTIEVHGTRYKQTPPPWRAEKKFQARAALGELCEVYRRQDKDFHGEPYLVPNPEMALQWRSLLSSLGNKPKIGITWTGGLPHTGQKRRSVKLHSYELLFKHFDADWVSLQYKEPGLEDIQERYGIKIHDWDWGTRVLDYDQTVALVSELDLVISVCTAVVDVCAAVGTECWTLVPSIPFWRVRNTGDSYPWGKSVSLYRQRGREWPFGILLGKLRERFADSRH